MKKYVVSSDKNIVVNSGWDEAEYFGEYTILEQKNKNYISAIIVFDNEENAKKAWSEHLTEDGNLTIKQIII